MKISYEENHRILQIMYEGEIDHHTCLEMAQISDDAIHKYLPNLVIFDFGKVTFMDSSGIGMILGRYKKIIRFDANAKICHAEGDLKRILNMSGIFKIIPLIEEEEIYG